MKKVKSEKLVLSRETLKTLEEASLSEANGGIVCGPTCWSRCVCPT